LAKAGCLIEIPTLEADLALGEVEEAASTQRERPAVGGHLGELALPSAASKPLQEGPLPVLEEVFNTAAGVITGARTAPVIPLLSAATIYLHLIEPYRILSDWHLARPGRVRARRQAASIGTE
jgi:hypothetical protein